MAILPRAYLSYDWLGQSISPLNVTDTSHDSPTLFQIYPCSKRTCLHLDRNMLIPCLYTSNISATAEKPRCR